MNEVAADLEKVFRGDVERIADSFIQAFNLTFARENRHLSYAPYRWLEFALMRYVTPAPRQVLFSHGFWRRAPKEAGAAVDDFAHRMRHGEDINAYQGRGLTMNDVSGAGQRQRTDLLLADFGIHHFHLTDEPLVPEKVYSRRSNWLLFAVVRADALLFVDVLSHPKGMEWAQKDVLETAVENWPQAFAHCEVKGVTGADWSDEKIDHLRGYGVNTPHRIGSRVYCAINGGLTSAGTPLLVHRAADRIQCEIADLVRQFADQNNPMVQLCRERGVRGPEFRIVLAPEGIAVAEQTTLIGAVLTEWPGLSALAPSWAICRLTAFCAKIPP